MLFILFYIFIMTLTLTYVSLISPDMEDRLPNLGITFSSFVAIHPYLTKLRYNIGQLTHMETHFSNSTHGGDIQFYLLGCICAFNGST